MWFVRSFVRTQASLLKSNPEPQLANYHLFVQFSALRSIYRLWVQNIWDMLHLYCQRLKTSELHAYFFTDGEEKIAIYATIESVFLCM